MANRYWVGGTANWDQNADSKWASTSGGAGGQSVPTSSDDVFFDANSGNVTVTVTTGRDCRHFNTTGFTGSVAAGTNPTNVLPSGDVVLGASTGWSNGPGLRFNGGTHSLTTNGVVLAGTRATVELVNGAVVNLADDLTTYEISLSAGTFNANDKNVTIATLNSSTSGTQVINMGAGDWTIGGPYSTGSFLPTTPSSALTINKGTADVLMNKGSSLNLRGHGLHKLTLGIVFANINGGGSIDELVVTSLTNQLTFTAGETVALGSLEAIGDAGTPLWLRSSEGGQQFFLTCDGEVVCDYLEVSDSHVSGAATWFAGKNSKNLGGNTGWKWPGNGRMFLIF